jgi:hypothetical protein
MAIEPKFWRAPPFMLEETIEEHNSRSQKLYQLLKGDSEERFRAQLEKCAPIDRYWFSGMMIPVLVLSSYQTGNISCLSGNDWCYRFKFKNVDKIVESAEINFDIWQPAANLYQ